MKKAMTGGMTMSLAAIAGGMGPAQERNKVFEKDDDKELVVVPGASRHSTGRT